MKTTRFKRRKNNNNNKNYNNNKNNNNKCEKKGNILVKFKVSPVKLSEEEG